MFQKTLNSKGTNMESQEVRLRPDEKPEAEPNKRHRGSHIKLSSKGPRRQHKRKSRRRS